MSRPPAAPTSGDDAKQAVERATGKLTESYQRWPKVRGAVAGLEGVTEENHFSEKIAEAYRSR